LRKRGKRAKKPSETAHGLLEESGIRPFWSGTITFGLVSIPVDLFPGSRTVHSSLRMLGPSGIPLSRRYFSPDSGKDLDDDETIRGYEIGKNKYVPVTDEELERLAPEKSRDIDLRRFVNKDEIEPIYFEHAYFLAPAGSSVKAYQLLAETMEQSGRAGIATFVMRDREYLVAILAERGVLRAETLLFSDEVRSPKSIGLPKPSRVSQAAAQRFARMIQKKSAKEISRQELRDDRAERLLKLVERKQARHQDIVKTESGERKPAKVVDLMEVLKQSLTGKRAA
jgi:DNA end-binding protein Ku